MYNINFDLAALALSITVLVHFLSKKNIMNKPTKIFYLLLWLSFLTCSLDIITAKMSEKIMPDPVVYISNGAYLVSFVAIPYVYLFYIVTLVNKNHRLNKIECFFIGIPFYISALLIATTPYTHWIFYNDPVTSYTHGKYYSVLYIFALIYMIVSLYLTTKYRMRLTYSQLIPTIFYSVGVLACIILQIQYPNILILQYVGALSVLLMYLSVENPRDYEDKDLGSYNRRGFIRLVSAAIESEDAFSVITIRFNGYQSIRETLGAENRQLFMKEIADYISQNIAPHQLCSLTDGMFAIFVKNQPKWKKKWKNIKSTEDIINFIQEEFNSAVKFRGMEIVVSASLYTLSCPEEIQSIEDILDMIDYANDHWTEHEKGVVMHASEEIIQKIRRNNKIELIMKRALANRNFEVYYQPIYCVNKKRFCSAEALLRLKDEEMGFISPDEFIPIAEKTGLIFEIGEFVFHQVCGMMSKQKIWERGIEYIEINLSPVQCIEEDLHAKLFSIMDSYEIPYDRVNLEITETATISSEEVLRRNIEPLLANGVTFSLDDYGTGYSNLSNVISYPFHIIKIDKSMVWSAMDDERAMRALRHTVAMIKDLDINIVAEGVETIEQAKLLGNLGCGFLQGYYFSKPVSEKDFIKMI